MQGRAQLPRMLRELTVWPLWLHLEEVDHLRSGTQRPSPCVLPPGHLSLGLAVLL